MIPRLQLSCRKSVWAAFSEPGSTLAAPQSSVAMALETLSIVAHEQPVTRADIRCIRGVDSGAVVETLMARGSVAKDPGSEAVVDRRFWSPRRPFCAP